MASLTPDTWSAFLPRRFVARLAASAAPGPTELRTRAVVLCSDVSGFTRLTARLAEQERHGVDRLAGLLDELLARHMAIVAAHGGEVVDIAGDGVVACFPLEGRSEADVVVQAGAAAVGLQRAVSEPDRLSTHGGLAVGEVWCARVGGEPAYQLLFGGPAVRAALHAQHLAGPSETLVPSETARWLAPACCKPHPSGAHVALTGAAAAPAPVQEPAPEAPFDPREYLAPPLGRPAGLAREIRTLHAVFSRLSGLSQDGPDALRSHHELAARTSDALARLAPGDLRLRVSDKGLVLSLVFGTPGAEHVDGAERALRAGLELQSLAGELGLRAASGVAMGRAFCGPIGSHRRRSYMLLGPGINLAARLMEADRGRLLCGPELARACSERFVLQTAGTRQLKGLGEVRTYRPSGSTRPLARPLFGRDDERQRCRDAVDALQSGRGSTTLVVGPSGIGKTALLTDLLVGARARSVQVLVGSAAHTLTNNPFHPWRAIFHGLLGSEAAARPRARVMKIESCLASDRALADRAPLLLQALALPFRDTASTGELAGQARADATITMLADTFEAHMGGPAVVALEDGHWFDAASWQLLDVLHRRGLCALFVVTTRPEHPWAAWTRRLAAHSRTRRIDLQNIDPRSTRRLMAARLGSPVSEALARYVHQATRGHPHTIIAQARVLHEEGSLTQEDGQLALIEGSQVAGVVAPRLQSLLRRRVDALPARLKRVLKAASILGSELSMTALRVACSEEWTAAELRDAVDQLVARDHLVRRQASELLAFEHDTTQQVVYELLPEDETRPIHRAVATWLEGLSDAAQADRAALLAHHWDASGDAPRAVEWAERAGQQALAAGGYHKAAEHFARCVELAEDADTPRAGRARHYRLLAEASRGCGRIRESGEQACQALVLADERVPRTMPAMAIGIGAGAARLSMRRWLGVRPRRRPGGQSSLDVSRAWRLVANAAYFSSDSWRCVDATVRATMAAEPLGPSPELAVAWGEVACMFGVLRRHWTAARFAASARSLADSIGSRAGLARVLLVEALFRTGLGDWQGVAERITHCQEICREIGDDLGWSNAEAVRFWSHHYVGDVAAAAQAAESLLRHARDFGNVQKAAWATRSRGVALLDAGDAAGAIPALEESIARMREIGPDAELVAGVGALALAYAAVDRRLDAVGTALDGLERLRQWSRPTGHVTLLGYAGVAEVLTRAHGEEWPGVPAGDLSAGSRTAVELLRRYARWFPIGVPRHLLWRGLVHQLQGDERRARRDWRRGLARAAELSLKPDQDRLRSRLSPEARSG